MVKRTDLEGRGEDGLRQAHILWLGQRRMEYNFQAALGSQEVSPDPESPAGKVS